jgi:hypothetical protein
VVTDGSRTVVVSSITADGVGTIASTDGVETIVRESAGLGITASSVSSSPMLLSNVASLGLLPVHFIIYSLKEFCSHVQRRITRLTLLCGAFTSPIMINTRLINSLLDNAGGVMPCIRSSCYHHAPGPEEALYSKGIHIGLQQGLRTVNEPFEYVIGNGQCHEELKGAL